MVDFMVLTGSFPAPDMPWGLVLAAVKRTPRYEARERLRLMDSVSAAIGAQFGGGGAYREARAELERVAYPQRNAPSAFVPNLWAEAD